MRAFSMVAGAALIIGLGTGSVVAASDLEPGNTQGGEGPRAGHPTGAEESVSPDAGTPDGVGDTSRVVVSRPSEWMVSAGAATSVELFHSQDGIRYAVQTLSWARDLTTERGPALLRGRLAWTVELMPVLAESAPTHVYGVGVAPIGLRWNLRPRPRWSAFTELGGGVLGSSRPIPTGVARFNFMAHWGAGVRLPVSSTQAVVIGYRFHHISNGNRLPRNPGVNSHIALVGWSLTRQH